MTNVKHSSYDMPSLSWITNTDIVFHILEYIANDELYGAADLNALARTCKALSDTALDVLWRAVPGFIMFLYLFPEGAFVPDQDPVTRKDYLRLTRRTRVEEWDRFKAYARRIKVFIRAYSDLHIPFRIHLPGYNIPMGCLNIGIEALYEAQRYNITFPNLLELEWIQSFAPEPPLLSRTLTKLCIAFSKDADNLLQFLVLLPVECPGLRSLELRVDNMLGGGMQKWLVEAFAQLPALREFVAWYENMDSATLRWLASSPIEKLVVGNDILDFVRIADVPFFPNLRNIRVNSNNLQAIIQFLHRVPNQLHSLEICIYGELKEFEIAQLFQEISQACPWDTFRSLFLSIDGNLDPHAMMYDTTYIIEAPTLLCLRKFKNLQKLTMYMPYYFNLSNEDMADFGDAWPQLRNLILGRIETIGLQVEEPLASDPCVAGRRNKRVILDGLISLARRCPNLRSVGASLTASRDTTSTQVVNSALEELVVGSSKVRDHQYVAQFLSAAFPNLRRLIYTSPWDGCGEWHDVEKELDKLNNIRDMAAFPAVYERRYERGEHVSFSL